METAYALTSTPPSTATPPCQTTRVCVVIPTYNCADSLERCVVSALTQTYAETNYNVIVVDDGSTDATVAVASALATRWAGRLTLIRASHGGPAHARNVGAAATTADVGAIAFLDADCVAAPDWLASLVERLDTTGAAGVGGPLINALAGAWVSRYLQAANFYRHRERHGAVEYLVTANALFRRETLLAVGAFSARGGVWGEDADLSFRLVKSGHTLLLAEGGAVTHYGSPATVGAFMRALFRYGYGSGVRSHDWPRYRRAPRQIVRRLGALALAPLLALSYTRRVGLFRAATFWPLIGVEHAAFCLGLILACVGWSSRRHL